MMLIGFNETSNAPDPAIVGLVERMHDTRKPRSAHWAVYPKPLSGDTRQLTDIWIAFKALISSSERFSIGTNTRVSALDLVLGDTGYAVVECHGASCLSEAYQLDQCYSINQIRWQNAFATADPRRFAERQSPDQEVVRACRLLFSAFCAEEGKIAAHHLDSETIALLKSAIPYTLQVKELFAIQTIYGRKKRVEIGSVLQASPALRKLFRLKTDGREIGRIHELPPFEWLCTVEHLFKTGPLFLQEHIKPAKQSLQLFHPNGQPLESRHRHVHAMVRLIGDDHGLVSAHVRVQPLSLSLVAHIPIDLDATI